MLFPFPHVSQFWALELPVLSGCPLEWWFNPGVLRFAPAMAAVDVSDVDVAAMLAALSSSNLPKEQLASVRSALESKKAESQTSKRKEMQDFSMFPLFLTSPVWDQIQSPSVDSISALDAVLDYLGLQLGLRCPSEGTQACLTAILVSRQEPTAQQQQRTASNLRALYLTVKSRVQVKMGKLKTVALPPQCSYLTMLPSLPDALPDCYKGLGLAFENPRIQLSDILSVARDVPLRSTNSACSPRTASDPVQMMQQFVAMMFHGMAGVFQGTAIGRPQQEPLQLEMLNKNKGNQSNLPALLDRAQSLSNENLGQAATSSQVALPSTQSALPSTQSALPSSQLALPAPTKEVEVRPDAATPPQPEFTKNAHSSPAADDFAQGPKHQDPKVEKKSTRLSLKDSMKRIQDARKQCQRGSTSTLKKPASSASSKPAAAKGTGPPVKKIPAMKKAPMKALKVEAKGKQQLTVRERKAREKAQILLRVPPDVKKHYAQGCATCRYVQNCTVSCWKKRGY